MCIRDRLSDLKAELQPDPELYPELEAQEMRGSVIIEDLSGGHEGSPEWLDEALVDEARAGLRAAERSGSESLEGTDELGRTRAVSPRVRLEGEVKRLRRELEFTKLELSACHYTLGLMD
eukprot:TRINITY_DN13154_c0_g1_i1.p1 TRINITY_DN13154_c0_g1~~TRINITY_DN13154_c0_g1_i1.p1  ORF type:complete len:120 (+),score=31.09 TRINITY_DN13154_c0_g1_i1:158-517(+)